MSEPQQPYNAADEGQVKERKRRERDAEKTWREDLRWLLSDPRGRRIVWRLLEWGHIFKPTFTGNSETFFREGERNVALRLLNDCLSIDRDLVATALREGGEGA